MSLRLNTLTKIIDIISREFLQRGEAHISSHEKYCLQQNKVRWRRVVHRKDVLGSYAASMYTDESNRRAEVPGDCHRIDSPTIDTMDQLHLIFMIFHVEEDPDGKITS